MDGHTLVIMLYMNDLIIIGNNRFKIEAINIRLKESCEMTDLGRSYLFLTMQTWLLDQRY